MVGFFICAPVGAIVALVLANSAQKRIEESNGRLTGLEQARAARIIAIVELALTAVLILVGGARRRLLARTPLTVPPRSLRATPAPAAS